ncbi:MAG: HAD family hydrolase [Nitrososphaeria archaeon]|nr:HAD family hydrolase [Nitrososphaeria archaeon]
MIRAVIFDLDGTLIEFKLDVKSSKEKVIHFIKEMVPDINGLDSNLTYYHILESVREMVDKKKFEFIKLEVYKILERFEDKAVQETSLKTGVMEALTELKVLGKNIALLTNSGRNATFKALKKFNILNFFDIILTRDDVEFMKPSTFGFQKTLSLLNLSADECVSVGDGLIDIIPSKALGIKFVAVSGGYNPIEKILEYKPDYIITSLLELPPLIKRL